MSLLLLFRQHLFCLARVFHVLASFKLGLLLELCCVSSCPANTSDDLFIRFMGYAFNASLMKATKTY
jgi:hypothetical protein